MYKFEDGITLKDLENTNYIPSITVTIPMEDIYSRAVANIIDNLQKSIDNIKTNAKVLPPWSKPEPFKESLTGATSKMGVYKIFHCDRDANELEAWQTGYELDDLTLMSIGCGIIANRKGRHKAIFLNDGKPTTSAVSASSSQTATKMYNHDPNLDNWYFSWCDVGNKELSHEYESVLIHQLKPKFNDISMAGR